MFSLWSLWRQWNFVYINLPLFPSKHFLSSLFWKRCDSYDLLTRNSWPTSTKSDLNSHWAVKVFSSFTKERRARKYPFARGWQLRSSNCQLASFTRFSKSVSAFSDCRNGLKCQSNSITHKTLRRMSAHCCVTPSLDRALQNVFLPWSTSKHF